MDQELSRSTVDNSTAHMGDLTKLPIALTIADLGGLHQPIRQLLAEWIDINPPRVLGVADVGVVDVNVEDKSVVGFGGEPVDVVLVVADGGAFSGGEGAVDGGADDVEVLVVLDAVVVAASEVSVEDEEAGGHVVVAVGDHRASLFHREDLSAEDQVRRQAADLREIDRQAFRSDRRVVHPRRDLVEVERLEHLREVNPVVERFERLLKLDVLDLVVGDVLADRVQFLEPVVDHRRDVLGEKAVSGESLDQGERGQALQGTAGELAARLSFLGHRKHQTHSLLG